MDRGRRGRLTRRFNFFSRGPQVCPGTGDRAGVGATLIDELLAQREREAALAGLDPAKPMPHMLDYFGIELELAPALAVLLAQSSTRRTSLNGRYRTWRGTFIGEGGGTA